MRRLSAVGLGTVAMIVTAIGQFLWAQQNGVVETPTIADQILNGKPSFLVAVDVNRKSREYRQGDNFSLTVASEEDAYLYVLYQQADGKVFQVYPNKFQPNNIVKARQAVHVPAENDMFRWSVGAPFGKETVKVIASKEPVDVLSDPGFIKARFNPVDEKQVKGIEVEMAEAKPIRWAESDVSITTVPNTLPPADSKHHRYGVFIGVSERELDNTSVGKHPAYVEEFASSRNARKMAEVMQEQGRLEGVRMLLNTGATKKNIEDALTKWLPSVSRPGDTVFVFYSGISGQKKDLNGDESDGMDEYLQAHDTWTRADMAIMKELKENGKLEAYLVKPYDARESQYQELGEDAESKWLEHFAISDDLLARWLQRLDGRQVVFIADSNHGGGYVGTDNSKSLGQTLKSGFHFDFLEGESQRLNALGQGNHAIFCAAHVNETTTARPTQDLGVMTFCLAEYLLQPGGGKKIEDCYQTCDAEMAKYFAQMNRELEAAGNPKRIIPSHPLMINHSKQPVIFKP